jgi:hypothetical protein
MQAIQNINDNQLKEKATTLAEYLEISPEEVSRQISDSCGMTTFEIDGCEYAIATDGEADKAARESMEQSVWAFNAEFILGQCNLPRELADGLKAWQEKECEGCNDDLLRMVERLAGDSFFEAAICADGRGHFITSYDGEENEQGEFFIYRMN